MLREVRSNTAIEPAHLRLSNEDSPSMGAARKTGRRGRMSPQRGQFEGSGGSSGPQRVGGSGGDGGVYPRPRVNDSGRRLRRKLL